MNIVKTLFIPVGTHVNFRFIITTQKSIWKVKMPRRTLENYKWQCPSSTIDKHNYANVQLVEVFRTKYLNTDWHMTHKIRITEPQINPAVITGHTVIAVGCVL